jgi:hypothetical protein
MTALRTCCLAWVGPLIQLIGDWLQCAFERVSAGPGVRRQTSIGRRPPTRGVVGSLLINQGDRAMPSRISSTSCGAEIIAS